MANALRDDIEQFKVNVPCQAACPIMTDVAGYIEALVREDFEEAYRINRMDNVLPGVLGRICHRPCEPACRHGRSGLGDPLSICFLKRSAADFGMKPLAPEITRIGKAVCIIGSGPAGLTAANDLALRGWDVTLLEQFDTPGGMLAHSIPAFRLPEDVVEKDIQSILELGVKLQTNVRLSSLEQIEDLQHTYDAVVFAAGCMLPSRLELAGDLESEGFYYGLDFLTNAAHKQLNIHPVNVVVIGGSFVAVDCTRTCFRLGASDVTMAYRRNKEYVKAGAMELEALDVEGIKMTLMTSPIAIESSDGKVTGVRMVKNELDEHGMAQPIKGSEYTMPADTVILAIGQEAEEYELKSGASSRSYLAGDFVHGAGTVVEACADGRKIAQQVHADAAGVQIVEEVVNQLVTLDDMPRSTDHDGCGVKPMPTLPLKERRPGESEVELGFNRDAALDEAHRCYLCQYSFKIDEPLCIYCGLCMEFMPVDCIHMIKNVEKAEDGTESHEYTVHYREAIGIQIDQDACIRCGECVKVCPTGCIDIHRQHLSTRELVNEQV